MKIFLTMTAVALMLSSCGPVNFPQNKTQTIKTLINLYITSNGSNNDNYKSRATGAFRIYSNPNMSVSWQTSLNPATLTLNQNGIPVCVYIPGDVGYIPSSNCHPEFYSTSGDVFTLTGILPGAFVSVPITVYVTN